MKRRYYFLGYNLADWLSIYRIVSFPVLLFMVLLGQRELFSWLLLVSFFTDAVDGYIARRLNIETKTGAKLDSIGDTLTLVISMLGILQFEWNFITTHYLSLSILAGLYFLEMVLAYVRFGKTSSFHTYLDKAALVFLAIFILSLLFVGYNSMVFYAALASGILSVMEEIILVLSLKENLTNIKGLFWISKQNLKSFN